MATLSDVAERAGVSISTVSRVVNEPGKVATTTRARVSAAIQALDYRPSRVAQRLRASSRRAHLIGLVIPDVQNPFYSSVVRGVNDVAYAEDYATLLCSSDEDPERERFYLDVLRQESAAGVILPPLHDDGTTEVDLSRADLPVVCFDRRPRKPVDTVLVDSRRGAREVTEHLLQLGHRRIALVCGPLGLSTSAERRDGYLDALAARGLDAPDGRASLMRSGPPTPETGRRAAAQLLDLSEPPTAIFAANNQLALGALETARARALALPDELALVGFDDPPWAKLLAPSLTTVRQPAYEMGRRAAEMLLQRIAEPERAPATVTLDPSLVVRRSCGASAAPGPPSSR